MAAAAKLQEYQSSKSDGKMIPVHVSKEEVRYFNFMQGDQPGKQSIDPKTHLREYSKLWKIIQEPKMKQFFIKLVNFFEKEGRMPEKLDKVSKTVAKTEVPPFEYIPSDDNPRVEALDNMGTGEDKILVLFPIGLANFFDSIRGKTSRDPTLGLQQFGFFKELVRIVATVGGAIVGGPVGAGIGNTLAQLGTGRKFGEAAKQGLGAGALAYGAGMIPGVNSALGHIGNATGLSGLAGSLGLGGGNAAASAGAAGLGSSATAAKGVADAAAGASSGGGGMLSGLMGKLREHALPAASIAGGLYLMNRGQKKEEKKERENYKEAQQRVGNVLEGGGAHDALQSTGLRRHEKRKSQYYAKGGLLAVKGEPIIGPGRGQDDVINRDRIKEGGWIWNATNVAHLGDGATDAGQKHIESFEKEIKKQLLKPHAKMIAAQEKTSPPRNVPCALSNGERHTPRPLVTALGHGDNKYGAHILRKINEKITEHKLSNGKKLPPPAHDLMTYYKMVN